MLSKKTNIIVGICALSVFLYMFFAQIDIVSPGEGVISGGATSSVDIVTPSSGFISRFSLKSGQDVSEGELLFSYVNMDVFHEEKALSEIVDFYKERLSTLSYERKAINDIATVGQAVFLEKKDDVDLSPIENVDKTLDAHTHAVEFFSLLKKRDGMQEQEKLLNEKRESLKAKISNLKKLNGMLKGAKSPEIEIIKNESEMFDAGAQITSEATNLLTLKINKDSDEVDFLVKLLEKKKNLDDQYHEFQKALIESQGKLALLKSKIETNSVKSPVDGVVVSIEKGFAENSYVDASKKIMTIKKNRQDIVIEAKFEAKYRPFIHNGGSVNIVLNSPGYKKTIKGVISKISVDSFVDESVSSSKTRFYNVDISIEKNDSINIESEGMQVSVFAISKKIPVIDYVGSFLIDNVEFYVW